MTFDLPTISALVRRLGAKLVPGWTTTCELAPSVEANQGALAMVYSTPERQLAHVVVAPHPPGESIEESVAHELTHALLSPLTSLLDWSPAAVMLEEQIVERLGKLLATAPAAMSRAVTRALANPRTKTPVLRQRISALATRRRNVERNRTMPDANKLAELAMKAGEMGGREDVPEDVRALLQELVAALAGGGAAPESEAPMRDDKPEDGKPEPPMREEDMPEAMRAQYRTMRRAAQMSLESSIRLRIQELRTVDRLAITPDVEARLRKAKSVEDFEDRLELVRASLGSVTEQQRKRSGVTPDTSDANGAPSLEAMTSEGIPAPVAEQVRRAYAQGKPHGETALTNARKYRKAVPNG